MLRLVPIILALQACGPDETIAGYTDSTAVFVLQSIDGSDFDATATLFLGDTGRLSGNGPCNSFFADQTAPYPWFDAGPIAATRRACPALAAEGIYFEALSQMTISEVLNDVLILSNDAGREMVFQAE